jgi:hypothetical protein
MNKKLGLAVAGALVAFSSAANAGITVPAGDWTIDIGGNVNAYYTNVDSKTTLSGTVTSGGVTRTGFVSATPDDQNTIGTGLLPAALGIGAAANTDQTAASSASQAVEEAAVDDSKNKKKMKIAAGKKKLMIPVQTAGISTAGGTGVGTGA